MLITGKVNEPHDYISFCKILSEKEREKLRSSSPIHLHQLNGLQVLKANQVFEYAKEKDIEIKKRHRQKRSKVLQHSILSQRTSHLISLMST